MRLIDGTALFRALREEKRLNDKEAVEFEEMAIGYGAGLTAAMEIVKAAPTIEPKRGRWEITDAYPHNVYCSECYTRFAQTHWAVWEDGSLPRKFCPNCGARMEGEDEL